MQALPKPTVISISPSEHNTLKNNSAPVGNILNLHASAFTQGSVLPWNPPKHYLIVYVLQGEE